MRLPTLLTGIVVEAEDDPGLVKSWDRLPVHGCCFHYKCRSKVKAAQMFEVAQRCVELTISIGLVQCARELARHPPPWFEAFCVSIDAQLTPSVVCGD